MNQFKNGIDDALSTTIDMYNYGMGRLWQQESVYWSPWPPYKFMQCILGWIWVGFTRFQPYPGAREDRWLQVIELGGHYTKSTPHRLTRKNTKFQWSIWSLLGNILNAFLVSIDSESMKI